ncbi:MAG: hypothetical protein WC516_04705 [Patescibacteria group bacterium]|jgi:hypothetical protein
MNYKRPEELCIIFNNIKPVYKRTGDGAICNTCLKKYFYKNIMNECYMCKNVSKIVLHTENGPICSKCYEKHFRPTKICSKCGRNSIIKKIVGGEYICKFCYINNNKKICSLCVKNKQIAKIDNDEIICKECYQQQYSRPVKLCKKCNKIKEFHTKKNVFNMCNSCYTKWRIENDQRFVVIDRLRKRLKSAFKVFSKNGKIKKSKEYGIYFEAILKHIGPCPGKCEDFHIDHVTPLHLFNFNNPDEIKKAFAPENHQWLKKEENLRKGGRLL